MSARHRLLESPALGRRAHVWCFGEEGAPVVVFPSNAGVAHEWSEAGMVEAVGPLLAARRLKLYCVESNVSRTFSGKADLGTRLAEHHAYERFVMDTLVPFIRGDCRLPGARIGAAGCSLGALYAALFVLKEPETFHRALCLSGRYRARTFFGDHPDDRIYFNDPLSFVPNLAGAPLERVRRAHLTIVVGRGAHENGCVRETAALGRALTKKRIPSHVAFWGEDSEHGYTWWKKQARHYLSELY